MTDFTTPQRITAGPDRLDDEDGMSGGNGTTVLTATKAKTKKPALYKVLMMNDDYTPMEFVVHTLQRFFKMSVEQATQVMLHVHQRGVGVCGIFTYEVAETKVNQVTEFARKHQHPLQCTMEKE
jgi:ATP-dependent Clp protease adaptor protein ClpS